MIRITLLLLLLLLGVSFHNVAGFSPNTHNIINKNHNKILRNKKKIISLQCNNKNNEHDVLPFQKQNDNSSRLNTILFARGGGGEVSNSSNNEKEQSKSSVLTKIGNIYSKNFFLFGMFLAVTMAKLFPALGKNGGIVRPELFIGKFGVTFIFLLSGLSLELSELKRAISNWKFNTLIQVSTFLIWPFLIGKPLVDYVLPSILPQNLLDGMLILSCLPTTVNMCIVLTSTAGGNVASALCNAVLSNLLGIFVTPALLLRFFGTEVSLPFFSMVYKLCNQVLVPVAIGQVLRNKADFVMKLYTNNSKKFKKTQELILLGIVWNAFCNTFASPSSPIISLRHFWTLTILLPTLHLVSLYGFFLLTKLFLKEDKELVVAGMFCASHKTLAFGLPLINTIFEGHPNLAAFCAPLMFLHPLQAFLGSIIMPRIQKYINNSNDTAAAVEG